MLTQMSHTRPPPPTLTQSKYTQKPTLIDYKIVVFWLNLILEYLSENTSGWLQLKKKTILRHKYP